MQGKKLKEDAVDGGEISDEDEGADMEDELVREIPFNFSFTSCPHPAQCHLLIYGIINYTLLIITF